MIGGDDLSVSSLVSEPFQVNFFDQGARMILFALQSEAFVMALQTEAYSAERSPMRIGSNQTGLL